MDAFRSLHGDAQTAGGWSGCRTVLVGDCLESLEQEMAERAGLERLAGRLSEPGQTEDNLDQECQQLLWERVTELHDPGCSTLLVELARRADWALLSAAEQHQRRTVQNETRKRTAVGLAAAEGGGGGNFGL